MTVPEFQTFMLPVLRALQNGEVQHWRSLCPPVAQELGQTEDDLAERLGSGETRFDNRIQWAIAHLVQAALLNRPSRGHVEITDRGRAVLADNPMRVDAQLLTQFEEYRDFLNRSNQTARPSSSEAPSEEPPAPTTSDTPKEALAKAVAETNAALATEILQRVMDQPPVFLELLVLKLLTAMGYGGRAGATDSTEHMGRSGDGGIDGVVRQDVLGLDRVYVQAKRYAANNSVGRPDIQAFVGALHGQQADRGVFITTSRFSAEARSYVERIPNRIVLIDGPRLAELMILHNVGVQDESTFVLKRVDEDFFEQP